MSEAKKISINAQIEEVEYELKMRAQVYGRRDSVDRRGASERELHVTRLKAVLATLIWLRDNSAKIKAAIGGDA